MVCCVAELCRKDVIDVQNGNRLGYVSDVEVETCSGQITSVCVKQDCIFSIKPIPPVKICWNDIVVIGKETVLVKNVCINDNETKNKKSISGFFRK